MFWIILKNLFITIAFIFAISEIILAVIDREYQKLWNKEKALKSRLNPKISNAELCEYYVMFCKRNNCKVDF